MMPPVHIVTGNINAGKTARMRELYLEMAAADGILSEKLVENGAFYGYRLVHLRSGAAIVLALLDEKYHGQFPEACRIGSFVFSADAIRFGINILEQLCANPTISAIFLDEVGPLELGGCGFADVLPVLLHAKRELYITVRSRCVQEFLQKYRIMDYRLITVMTP